MNVNDIYKDALFKSSMAFAYHEALFDDKGKMIDYRFVDVNPAFEASTGLNRENILGKRFLQDVASDKIEAARWVGIYEQLFTQKNEKSMDEYSKEFMSHYYIEAYPIGSKHFVTIFKRTSNEHKMENITTYFLEHVGKKVDYQLLTKMGLEFSGADYAVFNLYDEKDCFVTKAVLGLPDKLEKILKMLNLKLVGKRWHHNPDYDGLVHSTNIVELDELSRLVGNAIPKVLIKQIQSMFKIGKVVLAEIRKDQKILGNFTLIFEEENKFINTTYLNIYLKQLGVFIDKCQIEKNLDLKEQEAEILASKIKRDTLTNSYNRTVINTLLTDRLILCSRNKIKSYLVMLDIDNFKTINDNYGHQIGDAVLRMFVDRVNETLRSSDLLVRIGGDEFLLYLENISADDDARHIMDRIFGVLSQPYLVYDEESDTNLTIEASLSAGIARFPIDGTTVKELMSKADYTMYRVKKMGKNDFAFFALDKDSY